MGLDRNCYIAIMSWYVNISLLQNGIVARRDGTEPTLVLSSILLRPLSLLLCCSPSYSFGLNDVVFALEDKPASV